MRLGQGIGGAMLYANSPAIITDAFPLSQRGFALGHQRDRGESGSFIGLALGGLLAPVNWRLTFLVSVPIGLFGTVWAYLKLRELRHQARGRIDVWGNVTFAAGLIAVMVAITYGIVPYGGHATGWTSPRCSRSCGSGVAALAAFV